ncbi:DUF1772 domain-containing protein (plasmid) [Streptomyces sp. NBC_00536]|uniref:DUF1772 domain-containing protein n=1 Tax=Streptomyces sp. NBC_00536 TaxID=2975769 RepID=UPI002E81D52C|nr:DUF1772 domain-containing protein [Streptomyces sp. NBC_00536]WUC84265.1 DUF1772 domain-containing protein [Streptomyces sp. NBC_00536]
MEVLLQTLAVIATMANAVVYGTDVFGALVQRPALAHVDDATLTSVMGQTHRFGDARMVVPGVSGLVSTVATAGLAGFEGKPVPSIAAGVSALALVIWLAIYNKVSVPVNKALTSAALECKVAPDARGLQRTWDSVINVRVLLQAVALGAMCVVLSTT